MLVQITLYAALCTVLVSYIASAPLSIVGVNSLVKPSNAKTINSVQQFLQLKTGPSDRQAYWYYNGLVRNPLTGIEVAGIEGIEIVRPLDTSHTPSRLVNGSSMGEGFAGSYLSNKVFVYVDKANRTSEIEKYRVRHHAPQRTVNPVKQFAELITVGVEPSGDTFATIGWPTGRTLHTNKVRFTQSDDGIAPLDQLLGKKKINVINFMSAAVRRTGKHPLSKWVSFSPSSDDGTTGRSQEYYTISNTGSLPNANSPIIATPLMSKTLKSTPASTTSAAPGSAVGTSPSNMRDSAVSKSTLAHKLLRPFRPKPSAVLSYRHYGEGPPWFAVGKACVIEMSGARYDTAQALPAAVRELVDRLQPDFFSSNRVARGAEGVVEVTLTENKPQVESIRDKAGKVDKTTAVRVESSAAHNQRGLLTRQWFKSQSDPADRYKPWYSVLLPSRTK